MTELILHHYPTSPFGDGFVVCVSPKWRYVHDSRVHYR